MLASNAEMSLERPESRQPRSAARWTGVGCERARLAIIAILVASGLGHAAPAIGQCEYDWRPGEGLPGLNRDGNAVVAWDPDGEGPESELLVVGGSNTIAGTTAVRGVATWDGVQWRALGTGPEMSVETLAVYRGELYAGGRIYEQSWECKVMRWDGESWHSIGTFSPTNLATIDSMMVYNDELIVGGRFSSVSGVAVESIVRWDGSAWYPLAGGTLAVGSKVLALAEYNGELVAGAFIGGIGGTPVGHIARWTGSEWLPLGVGIDRSNVSALAVYHGDLIVGGDFRNAGGMYVNGIARWDGDSWHPLGPTYPSGRSAEITALRVFDDKVIASGGFREIGGVTAVHFAMWDGAAWHAMGPEGKQAVGIAWSLGLYDNKLFAVGRFYAAGGVFALGVAYWDGDQWGGLGGGLIGSVFDWTVFNGDLVGVGFSSDHEWFAYAARRVDGQWRPIYMDVQPDGWHSAAEVYNGELIIAGSFTSLDGVQANRIIRWNGEVWQPLGEGLNGPVAALDVYGGSLIAAGSFTMAGGISANNIARWDGKNWYPLGGGANQLVYYLQVHDRSLFAAGHFTSAGGVPVNGIAKWNGLSWDSVGPAGSCGYTGPFAVHNDELLAIGPLCGPVPYGISRWDGTAWSLFIPATPSTYVSDMVVLDDRIAIAGEFFNETTELSTCMAVWNGTEWDISDTATFGSGNAVHTYNGEVFVGGQFPYWGIYDVEHGTEFFVTRWGPACAPGDINCDGLVDVDDVAPFVQALLAPEDASDCTGYLANVNGDVWPDGGSRLDAGDISAFIAALTGM